MKIHAKHCWETHGEFWDPKMNARRRWGEFRYWDKMHARRWNGGTCRDWSQVPAENWWEGEGKLDIETRMNARSCWDEKRKSRYWTQMTVHARSCGETRGSWDIETAWMREAVERHRWGGLWEATVEPDIKPNECRKLLRGTGNIEARWMQEVVVGHRGGSLDIKTKWTQEVMGRLRGKYRYWNPMNAGSLGSLMRGTGGKLDIETRWVQEVVERQGEKLRHWNQVEMHAKSC